MRVLSWDVGLRTLSYCVLEKTAESAWSIKLWDAIDVQLDDNDKTTAVGTGTKTTAKRKKVSTVSVEYAAQLVMDTLHRRAALFDDVDAIIVEQQPAGGHNRHSNVRMKVVSHVIQCYFYTRAMVGDKTPPPITFVSPASKLVEMERAPRPKKAQPDEQGAEATEATLPPPPPQPRQYALNKKFAITKTQELLSTVFASETEFGAFFNSSTVGKKDDLADSFLLNYYYILKKTAVKKTGKRGKDAKEAAADADAPSAPLKKARAARTKTAEDNTLPPEPAKAKKPRTKRATE